MLMTVLMRKKTKIILNIIQKTNLSFCINVLNESSSRTANNASGKIILKNSLKFLIKCKNCDLNISNATMTQPYQTSNQVSR